MANTSKSLWYRIDSNTVGFRDDNGRYIARKIRRTNIHGDVMVHYDGQTILTYGNEVSHREKVINLHQHIWIG